MDERIENVILDLEKSLYEISSQVQNLNTSLKQLEIKLFQMPEETILEPVTEVASQEKTAVYAE